MAKVRNGSRLPENSRAVKPSYLCSGLFTTAIYSPMVLNEIQGQLLPLSLYPAGSSSHRFHRDESSLCGPGRRRSAHSPECLDFLPGRIGYELARPRQPSSASHRRRRCRDISGGDLPRIFLSTYRAREQFPTCSESLSAAMGSGSIMAQPSNATVRTKPRLHFLCS